MSEIRPWLELIRFPLFGIPIVATLPGVVLASEGNGFSWRGAFALLTALLGYWAGMIKNDYFHRNVDAIANPQRPIPSGKISPKVAFAVASLLYTLCVILGFAMNYKAGLMVISLVFISHMYNKIFKEKGIWGSISLPLGIGLLNIFGALSVSGDIPKLVWYAFFSTFFYDFGTHIVNSFKDMERDRSIGIITTPLQIGVKSALILSAFTTFVAFFISLLPWILGEVRGIRGLYAIWITIALIATLITRIPLFLRQTESNGYLALKGSMIGAVTLFPALASTSLSVYISALIILPLLALTLTMLRVSKQEV